MSSELSASCPLSGRYKNKPLGNAVFFARDLAVIGIFVGDIWVTLRTWDASGKESVAKIRQQTLAEHRTYKDHFRLLCKECDESIRAITAAFEKLT